MAPVPEEAASIDRKSETGRTAFTSSSSISNSISGICTTVIIMFTSGHRCFTKAGQKMGKNRKTAAAEEEDEESRKVGNQPVTEGIDQQIDKHTDRTNICT